MSDSQDDRDFVELVIRSLDGNVSEEELKGLEAQLRNDKEKVNLYNDLCLQVHLLEDDLELGSIDRQSETSITTVQIDGSGLKATTGEQIVAPVEAGFLSGWSKLTTIAAGMLIGIFGASIVWANTIPLLNRSLRESKEIVFESYEDPEIKISGRFPTSGNRWFGGMVSVPEEDGMPAVEGTRVGKLTNNLNVRFSYARYIVDLEDHAKPSDEYTRSIEVCGSFFSTDPDPSSIYRIDLWAFSQTPEEIQPIWTDREHFQDNVLQQVGRNYTPELSNQPTWHKVKVTMEIPPGTRSIVVSLASGKRSPGGASSDRYLDDVRVHLVDTITQKD